MNSPKPNLPSQRLLPPAPALEDRIAAWTALRDQMAELAAHLEYLKLMLRLEQRKP